MVNVLFKKFIVCEEYVKNMLVWLKDCWIPGSSNRGLVIDHEMQNAFASALLDQLEDLGTHVKEHHRRLRPRHYSAIPQIEN